MAEVHAVLDFSGPMAVFAAAKDGLKVFEVSKIMQRRDAASFAEFLQSNLKSNGLDFAPGDRVLHRKFGEGTVIEAKAIGMDMFLSVKFDTVGEKNLMAAYVKLEKI